MKNILLISDTHGYLDPQLNKHIAACDEIWHAGDIGTGALLDALKKEKPVRAVYGNIDGQDLRLECPETLVFDCEGLKTCMIHIGGHPGKFPAGIKKMLLEEKPGLFVCGHSHILRVIFDKTLNLLHINPGACGIHGFHHMRTAVKFSVDGGQIKDLAVIELGKRTA